MSCPTFEECKKYIENGEGVRKYKVKDKDTKYFSSINKLGINDIDKIENGMKEINSDINKLKEKYNKLETLFKELKSNK